MNVMQRLVEKAQEYKGQAVRAKYIVNYFRNDELPMMIFSFLWTNDQASKRVKELNSKSKDIIMKSFDYYTMLFTQIEFSKPEPLQDINFDDYSELELAQYKDVHIMSMEIYFLG